MHEITLKFGPSGLAMFGTAQIVVAEYELTHDCGTMGELQRAVDRIRADLDRAMDEARKQFAEAEAAKRLRLARSS